MATLVGKWDAVQTRLDGLARQHGVAGATLGILQDTEVVEFATGVTSTATGVDVTPDTMFQIGSNTKVYTTTLVMQLVDAGEVDLDAPVRRYVPEIRPSEIKVRHLLNHTSGLAGDYFEDFGSGDDAIEKYVASVASMPLAHPTGAMFSYSNAASVVAGRVVERVSGLPYRLALRDRLLSPIGARRTTVMPEEMLGHRYAVGHMPGPDGPVPAARALMSITQAPAGSVTSATARDVLTFVRMHLDGGKAADGSRVLSSESVEAMQTPTVARPATGRAAGQVGLGWMIDEWGGERIIGHGGGTLGQLSFLQIVPGRPFAVCLLTNSATGGLLWEQLGRYLFDELAGIEMPTPLRPPATPVDLDLRPYVGRYERVGIDTEISADGDELVVTMTPTGANVELGIPPQTVRFQAVSRDLFVGPQGIPITFLEFDARGRPAYLHTGRAARRVQGTAGKANKAATTATRRATPAKSAAGKKAAAKKAAPRKAAARKTAAGGRKRAR